jgi:hypothetical protein
MNPYLNSIAYIALRQQQRQTVIAALQGRVRASAQRLPCAVIVLSEFVCIGMTLK